jgi:hypothetical protein
MANKESVSVIYSAFEPKNPQRFIARLVGSDGEDILPTFVVCSIDRPKCFIERTNGKNKVCWLPISAVFYDPVVPSSSQRVMGIIESSQTFKLIVTILDPTGDSVEEWELSECRFSFVNFGNLDWRNQTDGKIEQPYLTRNVKGDVLLIAAEISYECAILRY